MKVLLISNMYPSSENPFFGTFVKNVDVELASRGFVFERVVVTGKPKGFFKKIASYFCFYSSIFKKILCDDYDFIYVHYITHSLLPIVFINKLIKKPIVLNVHGSDVLGKRVGRFLLWFVSPVISRSKLIIVPSDFFHDVVEKELSFSPSKIYVSPSGGVDDSFFKYSDDSLDKGEGFLIGYVSRIEYEKGWSVLLHAISKLTVNKEKIKVLFIGSGSREREFIKKVKELGLEDSVEWIGGVSHEDLPRYYSRMHLFIFPTLLEESLGLVGLEAMASGVPVIGSDIGGLKTYISDEINGYLFEPNNHIQLAEKISWYMELSDSDRLFLSNNARNTAMKYHSKKVNDELARKLVNIIESGGL